MTEANRTRMAEFGATSGAEADPLEHARLVAENLALRQRIAQLEARQVSEIVAREDDWTQRFFEGIPQGLVKVDLTGAVRFANSEAQRLLGLNWHDLEQRFLSDFSGRTWHEDGRECLFEEYPATRCLVTGCPQPACIIGVETPSGDINWAIFTALPTFGEGGTRQSGALVVFVDITAMQQERIRRRAAEARTLQARKLEALGSLAGGVAHDMNNVLAVISGMAFVLAQGETHSAMRDEALEAIMRSCRRGRDLVRNLLGFARQGTRERRPVDLNALVDEVAALLVRTLPEGVELTCATEPALPRIMGDAGELTAMLMNLCINASDALLEVADGNPRRITLRTRTAPCLTSDSMRRVDCVHLLVEDTGCGIPPHILDKVFEPFYTTKPPGRGTGLGLSMVYGTVHNHGGNVFIDSEQGRGTTICVDLPALTPQEELDEAQAARDRRASSGSLRRLVRSTERGAEAGALRVLIVEDDADVLMTTARIVYLLGHIPVTAASGEAALEILRREGGRIGVALLDMRLPDMHGEQIFEALRELAPSLPVVLTSGHAPEERIQRTLERGALAMLPKPLEVARLRDLLDELRALG